MFCLLHAQIHCFEERCMTSALKTKSDTIAVSICQDALVFWARPWCMQMELFQMQQARCISSTRLASPFPSKDVTTSERLARLRIEGRLIILVQGYQELYDLSSSSYFDTDSRNNAWRYTISEPGLTGEHSDTSGRCDRHTGI